MPHIPKRLIYLPEKYELVTGDTFELFYRGILLVMNPAHYNIRVRCSHGSAYMRKFVFTPTENDIGEHPLSVEVLNDSGDILDSAVVTLVVHPVAPSPKEETYVLCVGDSLSAAGQWPSECMRRFTAVDGNPAGHGLTNLRFIGTREGQHGCCFEGYGGWRFEHYNTMYTKGMYTKYILSTHDKTDEDRHSLYADGASRWRLEEIEDGRIKLIRTQWGEPLSETGGVLSHVEGGLHHSDIVFTGLQDAVNNPFWNAEKNCVDFTNYAQQVGAKRIDICFVLLGWNASGATEEEYKTQDRLFIDNLRRDYPACRIVLMGLQMTSYDGLGVNYGTSWNYMEKNAYTKRLEGWYMDLCREYPGIRYMNLSGQFDSEYNYPTIERPANVRTAKTEVIQSNGVHPNMDGYMQIADAAYRQLNAILWE